ncbi:glycosyl transferase, group 1 family protein [Desulfurella amilsii]|uniref:Glycosyl transferase, group 1 family protein n=1 Tax=Desulfurella amilsii TaxID=1562698 RepID=A0A1X4XUI5_9BACT|nr:glycosyl transferase, group 1 family protein [Desulfurella amilsii]
MSFYLYKSDLFVLLSHYEGFGNSHIEAIATGLPSVVSKNVPSIEVARKCTLVCNTDAENIYNQIRKIIVNPKLYDTLSNNTNSLLQQFDINNYLLKLYGIYRELLN